MTSRLRAALRLLRAVGCLVSGAWQVLVRFPGCGRDERQRRIAAWSRSVLSALGVELRHHGLFRPGGTLLVSNHVSWLDILAIHALCPRARFVSKAEVRHWPLLGRMVSAAETLYLERERKRDALRVVHQIAQALQAGDMVAVFPEGTTGDGRTLLPFHANLLQAAIATATPIQPLGLVYADSDGPQTQAVAWVGEDTLAQSLWRIAGAQGLQVTVTVLPPQGSAHADRRALAEHLHDHVAQAVARGQEAG
ncbi:MAG: lysophospholipid acyltransferase family protein [Aquabacterium sp.]